MNTPLPLAAPSAGTHRPQMRALYDQLATHLGFPAEKLPTLAFDRPGLASAKATFNMQARRITIGQACEREFVQWGAYPFQLTVAHQLTHAVLYEAGYGATGHADAFLAVYGLVLGKMDINLVELEMERCATQNWPADVPPSLLSNRPRKAWRSKSDPRRKKGRRRCRLGTGRLVVPVSADEPKRSNAIAI
ncbi:hypothetical protein [Stenotrophomonas rhizophila]|uniref:hypothetical protein n=1 Tax=Stenotrophomonas rhizophila TaxID=216778 RepID=UPI0011C44872|nr:hypothetical protein [Stenotrophomonas rhizophila]